MVRILLDVDGVINAVDPNPPAEVWPDYTEVKCGAGVYSSGITIRYSPTLVERLTSLRSKAEIFWLTTWEETANLALCPTIGFAPCRLAGRRDMDRERRDQKGWWKLWIAQTLWEQDKEPFIWIDDDIRYDEEAVDWLKSLPSGEWMAISPHFTVGLTPAGLENAERFIAEHTNG